MGENCTSLNNLFTADCFGGADILKGIIFPFLSGCDIANLLYVNKYLYGVVLEYTSSYTLSLPKFYINEESTLTRLITSINKPLSINIKFKTKAEDDLQRIYNIYNSLILSGPTILAPCVVNKESIIKYHLDDSFLAPRLSDIFLVLNPYTIKNLTLTDVTEQSLQSISNYIVNFTTLEDLAIISAISTHKCLSNITLGNNNIQRFSLSGYNRLRKYLYIKDIEINSPKLQELYISFCEIHSSGNIKGFNHANLQKLVFNDCTIRSYNVYEDFSKYIKLNNLKLYVWIKPYDILQYIGQLTNLTKLCIKIKILTVPHAPNGNPIVDGIEHLSQLTNLTVLKIYVRDMTDYGFNFITNNLTNLVTLKLLDHHPSITYDGLNSASKLVNLKDLIICDWKPLEKI